MGTMPCNYSYFITTQRGISWVCVSRWELSGFDVLNGFFLFDEMGRAKNFGLQKENVIELSDSKYSRKFIWWKYFQMAISWLFDSMCFLMWAWTFSLILKAANISANFSTKWHHKPPRLFIRTTYSSLVIMCNVKAISSRCRSFSVSSFVGEEAKKRKEKWLNSVVSENVYPIYRSWGFSSTF